MSVDVRANGPATLVRLEDYDSETSLFKTSNRSLTGQSRSLEPAAASSSGVARVPTPSVEDVFEVVRVTNTVHCGTSLTTCAAFRWI